MALAMTGLACGGDDGAGSRAKAEANAPTCDDTGLSARDVIGTPPKGYEVVRGDRKAIKDFAEQFKPAFGDNWRGYDAKVVVKRKAVDGTAVIVLDTTGGAGDADEFMRGVQEGMEESKQGEQLEIAGQQGRMVKALDGSFIGMAALGNCGVLVLASAKEGDLRHTAVDAAAAVADQPAWAIGPLAQARGELRRGRARDLDDRVRRHVRALGGGDDRVRRGRLVQAVGVPPVGAQEREQPADALVGVDLVDQPDVLAREVELLGELALDHVQRHVAIVPLRLRLDQTVPVGVGGGLGAVRAARSCAGCCGCGWRRCAR